MMKLSVFISLAWILIGCSNAANISGMLNSMLGGSATPTTSGINPNVPTQQQGAAPQIAPTSPAPTIQPPMQAQSSSLAPANNQAVPSAAPQSPPSTSIPAANQANCNSGANSPCTGSKMYNEIEVSHMNNQLTHLRTAIELVLDFQMQYKLASSNPIIQNLFNMFNPILQASSTPPSSGGSPSSQPSGGSSSSGQAQAFSDMDILRMNGQLQNLLTTIQLFQDYQRLFKLPPSNAIIQQALNLLCPVVQASKSIPK